MHLGEAMGKLVAQYAVAIDHGAVVPGANALEIRATMDAFVKAKTFYVLDDQGVIINAITACADLLCRRCHGLRVVPCVSADKISRSLCPACTGTGLAEKSAAAMSKTASDGRVSGRSEARSDAPDDGPRIDGPEGA